MAQLEPTLPLPKSFDSTPKKVVQDPVNWSTLPVGSAESPDLLSSDDEENGVVGPWSQLFSREKSKPKNAESEAEKHTEFLRERAKENYKRYMATMQQIDHDRRTSSAGAPSERPRRRSRTTMFGHVGALSSKSPRRNSVGAPTGRDERVSSFDSVNLQQTADEDSTPMRRHSSAMERHSSRASTWHAFGDEPSSSTARVHPKTADEPSEPSKEKPEQLTSTLTTVLATDLNIEKKDRDGPYLTVSALGLETMSGPTTVAGSETYDRTQKRHMTEPSSSRGSKELSSSLGGSETTSKTGSFERRSQSKDSSLCARAGAMSLQQRRDQVANMIEVPKEAAEKRKSSVGDSQRERQRMLAAALAADMCV